MPYKDKEKEKIYRKEYYKKYIENMRLNNPEKYKEKCRIDNARESKKLYLKINKEKINQQKQLRIRTERFKYKYGNLRAHAKRRNVPFNLNRIDFLNWIDKKLLICEYCNTEIIKMPTQRDNKTDYAQALSIDRKDNKKGYELNNIVLACYSCNVAKSEFFTYEEFLIIGKTINQIKKDKFLSCPQS